MRRLACVLAIAAVGTAAPVPSHAHTQRLIEKQLTLDIARRALGYLKPTPIVTTMTRTEDTSLPLAARAAVANRTGAKLFVSIHVDTHRNPGVRGSAVVFQGGRVPSEKAAGAVLHGVVTRAQTTPRGVWSLNGRNGDLFYVLRAVKATAVLVEVGVMSNPQDAAALRQGAVRQRIARGIADGAAAWLRTNGMPRGPLVIDPGHGGADPGAIR